ncbi:MAG: PRC-barrel domain-containing protein [Candidatus Pacearchaeota archaeon]|nr:PRC-barrel domain-containing protein [Candidatus Pacearchaeota archaeon]MDZ4228607.1 PRC-barrel domain-containing protein [Candidatus Levybacteria bacterium]
MLRIKKMAEVIGRHVYTSDGDYFGQIEDVNLLDNKVDGWKIKIGSGFMNLLGGARGVIIPQQFVRAIGDIFIVNRASLPAGEENIDVSSEMNLERQGFDGF